jgi:hypothetical protein
LLSCRGLFCRLCSGPLRLFFFGKEVPKDTFGIIQEILCDQIVVRFSVSNLTNPIVLELI